MKSKLTNIFLLVLAVVFTACSNDESTGTLNIEITDAPLLAEQVQEANVTITKVEVRKAEESEGSPFITVFEGEEDINLMELTNGLTQQLASLELPVGTYDLVRIYIDQAEVVLEDETSFDLTVPSGSATGLKVFINPPVQIAGGISADLLLDFDVSRSFVAKGVDAMNGFNFKPVIKAVNMSTVGRIEGTVSNTEEVALANTEVSVYAADTLNTTTFSNDLGQFAVLGLLPGDYVLKFNLSDYQETIEEASVVVGNSTKVDAILEQ